MTFFILNTIMKMSNSFDIYYIHDIERSNFMELSTKIFLGIILVVFAVLDAGVLVSLVKPGDERNQIIVWKASAYTLIVLVGTMIIDVIENFVRSQKMSVNPFIQLELTAIIYFVALLYFKKRHNV